MRINEQTNIPRKEINSSGDFFVRIDDEEFFIRNRSYFTNTIIVRDELIIRLTQRFPNFFSAVPFFFFLLNLATTMPCCE
jgi:hypothetical protein